MALIVTYDLTLSNMTKLSRHFNFASVFGDSVHKYLLYRRAFRPATRAEFISNNNRVAKETASAAP